jgi:hypothetical protein
MAISDRPETMCRKSDVERENGKEKRQQALLSLCHTLALLEQRSFSAACRTFLQ